MPSPKSHPSRRFQDYYTTASHNGDTSNKFDFRLDRIKALCERANEFRDGGPTKEYGAHTLVKLIVISSYANKFTTIAKGPRATAAGYDAAVYVDLFAGPGIIQIKERPEVYCVGSPIAATSHGKFDYSVFVEKVKKNADVLDSRIGTFTPKDKYTVIPGDCNEKVDEIIEPISQFRKPLLLVFVDPEGLEPNFDMLLKLSSRFPAADFVINLTAGTERVRAQIVKRPKPGQSRFDTFYPAGKSTDLLNSPEKGSQQAFIDAVIDKLGKPVGEIIPVIDSGGRTLYNVLGFSRSGTGSYENVLKYVREQLRGLTGEEVVYLLDVMKGERGTLDSMWK